MVATRSLTALSVAKERFKQPPAQRSLERTQTFKRLITRVEEAFVFQNESRQVVLRFRTRHAARLPQKIHRSFSHCLKKRFAVVGKSVRRANHQLFQRSIQFIEVQPSSLYEKLRPHQQNVLRNKRTRESESRIPETSFHEDRPYPGRNVHGASNRLQARHSPAARASPLAQRL